VHPVQTTQTGDAYKTQDENRQPQKIRNAFGTYVGWDKYVLGAWGEHDRVIKTRCDFNGGSIEVWHLERWVPVISYVKLLQPQPDRIPALGTQQGRYVHQQEWWQKTSKTFNLLKLPAELRELIYSYAIGSRVEPYPRCSSRGRGRDATAIIERNPNPKLLRLNRQVFEETSHVLYRDCIFMVEHGAVLRKVALNERLSSRLRQLHLRLTHFDYLKLFGFTATAEELDFAPSRSARALRKMDLDLLELSFVPPSLCTKSTLLDSACQKTVVAWILQAAWQWVKGHPVVVRGYIKTRQKVAFDAACAVERRRFELWYRVVEATTRDLEKYDQWLEEVRDDDDGGVSLTDKRSEHKNAMVLEEVVLPPRCRCVVRCSEKTWVP